jgi:hypothetical protein
MSEAREEGGKGGDVAGYSGVPVGGAVDILPLFSWVIG